MTLSHDENLPDQGLQLKVDDMVWRTVGDELVVLELPTSTYLTLNASARYLWDELVAGASASSLVEALCTRYGIPQDRARADVESFLATLFDRKLVVSDE